MNGSRLKVGQGPLHPHPCSAIFRNRVLCRQRRNLAPLCRSEKRAQNDAKREEARDKINNFESFYENVGLRYRQFKVIIDGESDLYMSHTVIRFIHFQKVD